MKRLAILAFVLLAWTSGAWGQTQTATVTPTPTATPAPTQTGTATPTPIATPATSAAGLAILLRPCTPPPPPPIAVGCVPGNETAGLTSVWVPPASGTTIPDLLNVNPANIQGDSTFTLPGSGINCQGLTGSLPGCDLTTSVSYTNPQPLTFLMQFSGTGGPMAQFGSSSAVGPTGQFYELFLDGYGRLSWGANNYGNLNVLQSRHGGNEYADGNIHTVVASIGPAGMNLYADGSKIASQHVDLANYSQGMWYFGGASLQSGSPSGNSWPYAPGQTWFNGTMYCWAFWNGTQLTDAQATDASAGGQ